MAGDERLRVKLLAGAGLVVITTSVGVLYKASQSSSGGFGYSTLSAITMAELIKLVMSCLLHVLDTSHHDSAARVVRTAATSAMNQLTLRSVLHILLLSVIYALNNQVSFFVYMLADPGTIYLFKASTTLITAATQYVFGIKNFSFAQWQAMVLQGLGMVVVQYDSCQSRSIYPAKAYAYMAVTVILSAVSSVRNEYLVKNYAISLNVQNAVLYAGGFTMNIAAFLLLPNPNSAQASIGFFDGYDNPLAICVVIVNAMIGLAITAVYKYADAVVKCIASNITSVLLLIISSLFFGVNMSLVMWLGVVVVCGGVNLYIEASSVTK